MQIKKLLLIFISTFTFGQNIENIVNIAIKNDYKLKNFEHTILSKKYLIKQAKDRFFPSFSLFSSISKDTYDQVYPYRTYNIDTTTIRYGADITQNIFDAKIFSSIKDAKLRKKAALLEKESYLLNLYQNVIVTYFEVLVNKENLKYYDLRRENFKKILQNISQKAKYGYSLSTDLSQAKSNYSIAKNDYIKAMRIYENSLRKLQILLNSNKPIYVDKKISNKIDTIIKKLLLSYNDYKKRLDNNPTIQSTLLYTKIAKNNIKSKIYKRYPTLNLDTTYYDTTSDSNSVYEKNRFRITLNLNIDLYKGGSISDEISEAKELYIAAKYDYKAKINSLELDFNKNWDNLQTSLKVIKSDKENIIKTRDYLKRAKESFKYKMISLSDYYEAQNNYYKSLINFENDKLNLTYYYISLLAKTAKLKDKIKDIESFTN